MTVNHIKSMVGCGLVGMLLVNLIVPDSKLWPYIGGAVFTGLGYLIEATGQPGKR